MKSRISAIVAACLLGSLAAESQSQEAAPPPVETSLTDAIQTEANRSEAWDYVSFAEAPMENILYFEMGALWLARNNGSSVTVGRVLDQNLDTIRSFSTNNFDYGFEPGMKTLLGLILDPNTRLEISYFGLNEWYNAGTLTTDSDQNPIASPFMQFGIIPADGGNFAEQLYGLNMHVNNIELNLKRFLMAGGDWELSGIAGFRYFNMSEVISLSQTFVQPPPIAPNATGEGTYAIAHNHLLGLQIGGEVLEDLGPLQLGSQLTAGAFAALGSSRVGNFQTQDGPNLDIFSARDDGVSVSALVQWGFSAEYMLFDCLAIRCGYDLLFITGLAFAPDQLAASVPPSPSGLIAAGTVLTTLDQDNFAFYHGPSVSMALFW